jgi:hypothetical protein
MSARERDVGCELAQLPVRTSLPASGKNANSCREREQGNFPEASAARLRTVPPVPDQASTFWAHGLNFSVSMRF